MSISRYYYYYYRFTDVINTGQPMLACTRSQELVSFVGAKFYCPHALAHSN